MNVQYLGMWIQGRRTYNLARGANGKVFPSAVEPIIVIVIDNNIEYIHTTN
jgi:hypothetical protein